MTRFRRSALIVALASVLGIAGLGSASADTWNQDHPRRAEVNNRLVHQDRRIHHAAMKGEITHRQAARLHHEDRMVRTSERMDASFHRGRLTKADQGALNQDENRISGGIYREALVKNVTEISPSEAKTRTAKH